MKRILPLLLLLSFCLSGSFAQTTLQDHIVQSKEDYRKYADKESHAQFKANREVTSYNVGDSRNFHRYDLSVMPPGWIDESATCRAVGDHSYIFVADADWETYMTQNDVDSVFKYLENATANSNEMGIVEMDQLYFGTIPDELDGDPKVIFYFSALGSYNGSIFDGYFSAYNQMTESEAVTAGSHSNECEMLYMSCNPVDPTDFLTLSVLAHELQHLIHFGYDENEETWIDEGCAEFAMVLFGVPDPISSFPSNSDNNLTVWDQNFSDYVKTMLFVTYLAEQTIGPNFVTALVANDMNGVSGIESALESISFPLGFQELFANWTIANYIDDVSVADGIYGYELLDLPTFTVKKYFTTYPAARSSTLNDCAAHYYKFNIDFTSLSIGADFPEGGEWELNLLTYEDDLIKEIIPFTDNSITFDQPEAYTLSKLILVVTNKAIGTDTKDFNLSINDINSVNSFSAQDQFVNVYPNPATDIINLEFIGSYDSKIVVNIFNSIGQNVMSDVFDVESGDLNTIDTQAFQAGIYYIKIENDKGRFIKKMAIQ